MQSASLRNLLLVGLLVPVAGCFPYGYQNGPGPYGQYPPVQYPGNPTYVVPPGNPYAPGTISPGSVPPSTGSPTPLTQPNTTPPPTYDKDGNRINWNNNAPPFTTNPPNGSTGGGSTGGNSGGASGGVPDPGSLDEPTGSGPAAANPNLTPTSSIRSNQRNELQPAFEQESNSSGAPAEPARIGTEPDPFEFEPPKRVSSTSEIVPATIQRVNHEVPAERLRPYGRDLEHANPEWLRGVVDFDEKTRTWQIIYAANPDPNDPNGGSLTLGNHPALSRIRSGDIATVEGAIDSNQSDSRGKPIYALDTVTPLKKPR